MNISTQELAADHTERFGQQGTSFSAPARVNLIGEHTDYTGGFVLPLAIGFETTATISPRTDRKAVLYSSNFDEQVEYELDAMPQKGRGHWSDYGMGVVWSLAKDDIKTSGFNLSVEGNVPLGSGLSSSASVEVAVAMALLSLAETEIPGEKIATLCRRAENDFVGAPSGIMDQFVITNAVAEKALLLDCRSLEFYLLPLRPDIRIVIANSMVKHSIAEGAYRDRREEVEAGQAVLSKMNPQIKLLRDATMDDLKQARGRMSDASYRRCRHIITENARVLEARSALFGGDMRKLGDLLFAAHISMRDDFEASAPEVDKLVDLARSLPGCIGSRITGGGFGGCTVNLVEAQYADNFAEQLKLRYKDAAGIEAEIYVCEAVDGAVARAKAGE
ncbi:galactokinase [Terriglobus saanensis]|uniref:Galactokinase n=1 Tax=Terriglobus saanensis (strain ATCC BAA-1853 / DSM 23119 / SP1PR4) TaxID=401053 RepID=E8V0Z0_TERSS|nr:galactokinase [Terriglobus saanensis]ADV82281.1 galactokinase [Terriglobus saanensis SP1PR4]